MNNKRIKDIILLAALPALLIACSSDRDEAPGPGPREAGQEICFSVSQSENHSKTRSTILEGVSDLQTLGISVTSKLSAETDKTKSHFVNERLIYGTDDWQMNKYYWIPNTYLDFYARAPYSNSNVGTESGNSFDYNLPTTTEDQMDLMYASMYGQYKMGKSGDEANVVLHFKHALSALSFKAKTTSPSMSVIVKGLTIHNLATAGNFTYPTGSTCDDEGKPTDAICTWNIGSQTESQMAGITETELSSEEEARSIMSENGVMMVMPQTLTGSITSGSYLAIDCKLMDTGLYLAGSADSWGTVYMPFDFTFEQGKHYTITLIFGVGYNSEGLKNQIRIDLESTITDWNRETMTFDKKIL